MHKLQRKVFDSTYQELILKGHFFEDDAYYVRERPRYFHTLQLLLDGLGDVADLSRLQILEVGGGQIALLMRALFGCTVVIADVNEKYGASLVSQGCEIRPCDLLHDDLPDRARFDVVILCEVIEHLPVPPYKIMPKVAAWMKHGGLLFLTTPNLYRLRNVLRLLLGMRVFDTFLIPDRGQPIGHPLEYSSAHLAWQLEQAGFSRVDIRLKQLAMTGATLRAKLARIFLSPLLIRPQFRDSLVALARNVKTA